MNDPVPCPCGCKQLPKLDAQIWQTCSGIAVHNYVICTKCGINGPVKNTRDEAVAAWDRCVKFAELILKAKGNADDNES